MQYLLKHWFAIAMLATGICVIALALHNGKRAIESKDWPTVTGTIKSSSIVTKTRRKRGRHMSHTKKHLPRIEFEYTVDNTLLLNQQLYFDDLSAAQIVKKYPVGSKVKVTYDPSDVNDSFLEPTKFSNNYLIFGMGAMFTMLGIAFLVGPVLLPAQAPASKASNGRSAVSPLEKKKSPVTVGEISALLGHDVRELKLSGMSDHEIPSLIQQKLREKAASH